MSNAACWAQTGKGGDTLCPFGVHPSYLNLMQVAFDTAGEKAWGLGGRVEFDALGAPGLSASAIDGSVLAGLRATLRYAWLRQDGAPQTGTQLRAHLNHDVR